MQATEEEPNLPNCLLLTVGKLKGVAKLCSALFKGRSRNDKGRSESQSPGSGKLRHHRATGMLPSETAPVIPTQEWALKGARKSRKEPGNKIAVVIDLIVRHRGKKVKKRPCKRSDSRG